jgi:enoyl-CoA hydratase
MDRTSSSSPAEPRPSGPPTLVIDGFCARVTLNRPRHHNRLEPADISRLAGILDEVERAPDIRALVLTASGPSFCSGYDLKDLAAGSGSSDLAGGIGVFAAMVDRLEGCRVPTICALNGPVYGGGTDLALACDFRLGLPGARMFMPAGAFGLHYYAGGLRRYTTRLGLGAAKRLFLLCEPIDAEEMLRIGYLDQILPDLPALHARAEAMVATLLEAASAPVINSMKRALNRIAAADMDPAEADAAWAASRRSPEVAGAVASALAGRRKR